MRSYYLLAGSLEEKKEIERIRGVVEDVSDEIRIYNERIMSWNLKYSELNINGKKDKA